MNTAAVEAIWARTRGGMKLSDRIWATSDNARDNMRSIILDGVARGRDSAKVARDLERYVKQGAATMAGDYPGMKMCIRDSFVDRAPGSQSLPRHRSPLREHPHNRW